MTCLAPAHPPGSRRSSGPADGMFLARSVADALRPKALLPVWAWILIASPMLRIAGGLAGGALVALSGLLVWGLVAAQAHWKLRTGRTPPTAELARIMARALPDMILAPLGTVSASLFFLALAAVGSLVGLIPVVGTALLVLWLATAGLALILLGAYWLLFALAASPLQVAAATAGAGRTRMEIVAESLGKVRRAPLRYLAGVLVVVACAAVAAAAAAAAMGALLVILGITSAKSVIDLAELWAPWLAPSGDTPPALIAAARLAPAILAATLFAGSARLDALLEEERRA